MNWPSNWHFTSSHKFTNANKNRTNLSTQSRRKPDSWNNKSRSNRNCATPSWTKYHQPLRKTSPHWWNWLSMPLNNVKKTSKKLQKSSNRNWPHARTRTSSLRSWPNKIKRKHLNWLGIWPWKQKRKSKKKGRRGKRHMMRFWTMFRRPVTSSVASEWLSAKKNLV